MISIFVKTHNVIYISLLCAVILVSACTSRKHQKPNVLLLYMDDLRPQLACYDQSLMQTPHIDALAARGMLFEQAYCNVAVCGASRASMLTGIRPTKTLFRDYKVFIQDDAPTAITLPKLFQQHGYKTISNGKVYHHLDDNVSDWDEVWRPYAFDQNPQNLAPTDWWQTLWRDYQTPENQEVYRRTNKGPAYERAAVADSTYIDGLMTQKVLADIEQLSRSGEPFFLTAGFISPHLPFNAPSHHWDKYPREKVHQPANNFVAKDAPAASDIKNHEIRQYLDIPPINETIDDSLAVTLIHGYYATVSYVDALIGKIMDKMIETGLDHNTIIVLVSDHGYNLQEHTLWAKWTSHSTATRVPLIIVSPFADRKGRTQSLVELVDLYPTLAEMCRLELPLNQVEGSSLCPILDDPTLEVKEHIMINNRNAYTIKTDRYCYTEYINFKTSKPQARMLYDHHTDPDENINIAESPGLETTVQELHDLLHSAYRNNIY